jgi:hypothetical protein
MGVVAAPILAPPDPLAALERRNNSAERDIYVIYRGRMR